MNDKIGEFLVAEDLDELQMARDRLDELDDEDIRIIRLELQRRSNPQSVANLLTYPSVIPEDIRSDALLRGLTDHANSYNKLAATVGLQDAGSDEWPREDIEKFLTILLEIIETDESVLADRASVAVLPYLDESHIDRVAGLLSHSSETARHNLLGWLYNVAGVNSEDKFIEVANAQNLSPESQAWALDNIRQHENAVASGGLGPLTTTFFAYIPNLKNS